LAAARCHGARRQRREAQALRESRTESAEQIGLVSDVAHTLQKTGDDLGGRGSMKREGSPTMTP